MSIKVEIRGHGVKQLGKFFRNFRDDIVRVNNRSAQRVAMKAEREAVLHITNQDLNWDGLSPRYLARKMKAGHSEKILVATSTYLQSITSISEKGRAWAGVKKDAKTKDGEDVASIAATLEFGSLKRGIPARPLWSVVLRDVADWVERENYFVTEIIKELKKKYGSGGPDSAAPPAPNTSMKAPPPLNTGSRGGKFYLSPSGRKVYQKRT